MAVDHTFLLSEGNWKAKGYLFDENEKSFVAQGETKIEHKNDTWIMFGTIKALGENGYEINNVYSIMPFTEKRKVTTWTSDNPRLGKLKGSFMINDEYIISLFESEDKRFSGTEYLIFISDDHYKNRGVVFEGNKKLSSWTLELQKEQAGET